MALLVDEKTADVIKHCGGSIARLIKKLETFLDEEIKPLPEEERERAQPTLAFARVVQRAVNHVLGAGKEQASGANVLVAFFSEPESNAVAFLKEEGITRLDVVSYISHGISKLLPAKTGGPPETAAPPPDDDEDDEAPADPLAQFAVNLNERARAGEIDPLIGRETQIERALHVLARRRKNNPLFVGDAGRRQDRHRRGAGPPDRARRGAGGAAGRDDLRARHGGDGGGHALPRRLRGALQGRAEGAGEKDNAIVFIDELHTIVGAGAASGGAMDASNLIKPALATGKLRCIGTTTHKEYRSYIEKDRALARRFQPIEVEEPTIDETIKVLPGAARALRGVPRRHLHRQVAARRGRAVVALPARPRLPDKAIDLIDEAGAAPKLKEGTAQDQGRAAPRAQQGHRGGARRPWRASRRERVAADDRERLANLEGELKAKIFGQDRRSSGSRRRSR